MFVNTEHPCTGSSFSERKKLASTLSATTVKWPQIISGLFLAVMLTGGKGTESLHILMFA